MNHMNSRQTEKSESTLIDMVLADLHATYQAAASGQLADYIPELAKADPNHFGIVIATVDGNIYSIGDSDKAFTIQSISKPFVFGLALEDHGRDHVLKKVGVEPSGEAFNSIIFDERANRPFNPMVNAGAIATTALIKGDGGTERLNRVLAMFERYVGHPVPVDVSVFLSEKATGHRNRAIGHLELNFGMIDNRVEEHLDLYFQQCSVLVTCRDLAVMAATLANGGVNPLTGQRAIEGDYVKNVIAVMNSSGMYDYSGEWSYRIGLPAKSGVGGGIVAVLPGCMGIGIFSPPLDERGNSFRGIKICEALSQRFGLNMFDATRYLAPAVRRQYDGGGVGSRRARNEEEQAFLERAGHRINVLELRGGLTFASIEQINSSLAALPPDTTHVILDFARVDEIEAVAATLIAALVDLQSKYGRQLRLAHLSPGAEGHARLSAAGIGDDLFFADLDQALEWAEEQLLAQCPRRDHTVERPLAEMDLVAGLTDDHLALLGEALERCEFSAGDLVMAEGDPADRLFFLAKGMVSIVTNAAAGRSKRLSTLNPGIAFGEMALLDGGCRSADVRADTHVVTYALELKRLDAFAEKHPAIQATLLRNLGRVLSQRLRKANNEIRSLG